MLRQHRHPLTEAGIIEVYRVRTPTSEANPAEVAGGGDLCLDEGLDGAAEHEVGAGDDAGAVLAALLAAVRRVDPTLRKPAASSGKGVTAVGWLGAGLLWRTALCTGCPGCRERSQCRSGKHCLASTQDRSCRAAACTGRRSAAGEHRQGHGKVSHYVGKSKGQKGVLVRLVRRERSDR